jgi:hypothetical protein
MPFPFDEHDPQDDLVTIKQARNEFEASIIVASLKDEGIEAFSFGMFRNILPVDSRFTGVPVQVRRSDLERAKQVLEQRADASADLDWDEIDVGEREDRLPLREPGRMPWPARIALVVAIIITLTFFAGFVVMLIW